jgi:TonB family protein
MRHFMRRAGILIAAAALFAALCIFTSTAQTPGHSGRRVVYKVAAVYPDLAKRDHIRGVVRLEVVVAANGTVKSTKLLGGAPVLIPSAIDAVRMWRFEAAPKETTEIVQIIFALP